MDRNPKISVRRLQFIKTKLLNWMGYANRRPILESLKNSLSEYPAGRHDQKLRSQIES